MSENTIRDFYLAFREVSHAKDDPERIRVHLPNIVCADGFEMSVQASPEHYSWPREYLEDGSYSCWEVGYPSQASKQLTQFGDRGEMSVIYLFVPTDVVNALIESHCGLGIPLPGKEPGADTPKPKRTRRPRSGIHKKEPIYV